MECVVSFSTHAIHSTHSFNPLHTHCITKVDGVHEMHGTAFNVLHPICTWLVCVEWMEKMACVEWMESIQSIQAECMEWSELMTCVLAHHRLSQCTGLQAWDRAKDCRLANTWIFCLGLYLLVCT